MLEALMAQRLTALFWAALVMLNFPMLALWDHDARWSGLPLFPTALFMLWALLIGVLAWVAERSDQTAVATEDAA